MNFKPVHQNLDTSFVNLSALLKFLRRRRFAGIVRVRLNNYEAEIHITDENQLNVREQDHLSGRVAEGEEALQRILIRSREPGGIVNVFQQINDSLKTEISEAKDAKKPIEVSKKPEIIQQKSPPPNVLSIKTEAAPVKLTPIKLPTKPKPEIVARKPETAFPMRDKPDKIQSNGSTNFPFCLGTDFGEKLVQSSITPEKFSSLVNLFGDILNVIDKTLAAEKLNFQAAFAKACNEIAADYTFLKQDENSFEYKNGKLRSAYLIRPNMFISGMLEAVRRILEKLGANPKFSDVYRTTVQNLLALLRRRKTICDEFLITNKLEKILGVKSQYSER